MQHVGTSHDYDSLLFRQFAQGINHFDDAATVVITEEGNDYVLHLNLPFDKKADLEVFKNEEQLIVRVGSYRRDLFLPGALALLTIKKASFESGELRISFTKAKGD